MSLIGNGESRKGKRRLVFLAVVAYLILPSGAADVLVSLSDDGDALNGAASESAVVIRTGEAEYRASVPLGAWYDIAPVSVNKNGVQTLLNRRMLRMDETTFRGQLNLRLRHLKETNPTKEIYLVTPVAAVSDTTRNNVGALLGDYAQAVREAGNVWAVTVIDLAGLAPVSETVGEKFFLHGAEATNRPISLTLR